MKTLQEKFNNLDTWYATIEFKWMVSKAIKTYKYFLKTGEIAKI